MDVGKSGRYSTKSMYNHLTRNESGPSLKRIWKEKIPEKIKIFMWLLENGATLTKDNMAKKNWQDNLGCQFL